MATSSNSSTGSPRKPAAKSMDRGNGSLADEHAGVSTWCNFLFDFPDHYARSTASTNRFAYMQGVNVLPQQPLSLMKQSTDTTHADIAIPTPVRTLYASYRPTLLRRAKALEERLGTRARLYYKFEGANVSGSHKLNTALAQAYYYQKAGVK